MAELGYTEIKIMILAESAVSQLQMKPGTCTHTHTCHVGPDFIQERNHVTALCNGTLDTRVEGIAREKGQKVGLVGKSRVGAVVVHKGLEAGDPANRFSRARS